jgi:hypothetical protein
MIVNHFKVFGEISNYIIRSPDPNSLGKLPEEKRNFILNHKYAFICYKQFDSASKAVNKVSYEKLKDTEYNKTLNSIVAALRKVSFREVDLYRCACYIVENCDTYKSDYGNEARLCEFVSAFDAHMLSNDNIFTVKDKSDRMECCQ